MKPVAVPALCAALLLSGCADIKRSTCVRHEQRETKTKMCGFYDRKGRCTSYYDSYGTARVCVDRRCNPGYDFGPNEPTNSFLPQGCLTEEEARKKGQG